MYPEDYEEILVGKTNLNETRHGGLRCKDSESGLELDVSDLGPSEEPGYMSGRVVIRGEGQQDAEPQEALIPEGEVHSGRKLKIILGAGALTIGVAVGTLVVKRKYR